MIIYGSIGYTILNNNNKYVIVFADMHDKLEECDGSITITDWLKLKFKTSHILLEEVSREDVKLKEIWPNSKHTQELKKLFLENSNKIKPIDIRPFLIPFSWELLKSSDDVLILGSIKLYQFLQNLDLFFCLKDKYLIKKFEMYDFDKINNTKMGNCFIELKKKYYQFICINKDLLNIQLINIFKNYNYLLDQINELLDQIMEWYTCASIVILNESSIIHTGLAHSEKIINILTSDYEYMIITEIGTNKLDDIGDLNNTNGCLNFSNEHNNLFG